MLDLFSSANGNADAVRQSFEAAANSLPLDQAATLRDFAAWVEANAQVSINARLLVIVELINGRTHQNNYEWAAEISHLSGRREEDLMRERLGAFYERRVMFDRAFANGEQFRYGALNAGNCGLPLYGPYCIILNGRWRASVGNTACLPGDSLELCFAADGSFQPTVALTRAAPYTHANFLVAQERVHEVCSVGRGDWATIVCSAGRYFEVIFVGSISLNDVSCVRVLRAEYNRMWDLAFANFGRRLDDAARALVQDFVQVCRGVTEGRLRIEIIE